MLTFLPFLRAVKAPAPSIGVCALILLGFGASCANQSAAHVTQGPPTGPLPQAARSTSPEPELSTTPDAGGPNPTQPAGTTRPNDAPSGAQFSLDLPYPADARPRAASPVQAAAEDEELARWNIGGSADPNSPSSQGSYHPGTRVVVDTRLAKLRPGAIRAALPRGLTPDRVQAQTRAHGYWPFRLCFEAGQREKKSSGGETRVAFSIGLRGKVRAARLLDSQLGNATSSACLVRELLKLEYNPRPARALAMVASIRIWPGDAELPALPERDVALAPPGGAFDANSMRARVAEKRAQLASCFDEARRADPTLWGRLALTIILEVDGSVHRMSEVESHFPSPGAARCVQVSLSTVLFPSVNGKPFSFVVPIRLIPNAALQAQSGSEQAPSPTETDAGDAG